MIDLVGSLGSGWIVFFCLVISGKVFIEYLLIVICVFICGRNIENIKWDIFFIFKIFKYDWEEIVVNRIV